MLRKLLTTILLTALATPASAQLQRVFINGTPSNLHADWTGVSVVAYPFAPDTFLALMPLSSLSGWLSFESSLSMDFSYGQGNWLRCRMTATDWAYLSPDPCAHLPGNNGGVAYALPLSLLTSNYDNGAYVGSVGAPHMPVAGATLFSALPTSIVQGLGNHWAFETWELRTRGFWPNDLWNGCAGSPNVTPNFSGWLVARFQFTFF